MKPAFFCLGFREPDCHVIVEPGGGPDVRPWWAGSGPRAEGCPPLSVGKSLYCQQEYAQIDDNIAGNTLIERYFETSLFVYWSYICVFP